jgi:hypothetical protein
MTKLVTLDMRQAYGSIRKSEVFVSAIPDSPASGVGVGGDEEELASANGIDGLREGS